MVGAEEALGESQVTLRMWVKTLPAKQWTVALAPRAGVKKAFEREGIAIPYPHRVMIAKTAIGPRPPLLSRR